MGQRDILAQETYVDLFDLQSARLENAVDSSWSGDACGVYGNRTVGKLVVELDLEFRPFQ